MRRPTRHCHRNHVIRIERYRKEFYKKRVENLRLFLRDANAENRRLAKVAVELFDECRRLKKLISESKATTEVRR